ncbi:MAG: FtsX-like permease family protein [Catenibacterium mitsuokai]|jgi:putative ABC transport system permease protein|uniref:FtsX-like permease family protein n=1 Tax=Catenibacterium mitsuokai TaxID=100886 RepID=UPI002A832E0F|nr:FtsX-like permease family protein [Catenibacterium mitsuokai]MDY3676406.1 FtsX-like permease family protein [Catenibacterium mitsuokai]MEE0082194.1 FtsX-like permease family protein [Catenibacterium mitsuokai]
MVKKRFYWKTVFKNISQSKGRFFSIFMIIFLGAAVFSGLRNTPYTMAASADAYLNSHNYADLTYIATLGFSDEDVAKVRKLKGVKKVVPCYQFDALFAHKDGKSGVTVYSQEKYEKSMLDRPELLKGRYPKKENECIIDVNLGKYNYKLGHTIELSNDNGTKTYKIVGIVNDPRYISNVDRGTNTLGDGTNSGFVEVLNEGARELGLNKKVAELRNNDHLYTSLLVDVEGTEKYNMFTSDYDNLIETVNTRVKSMLSEEMSDQYDQLTGDMQSQLDDAKKQYEEGYQEYKHNLDSFNSQISQGKIKLAEARIQFYEQKKIYLKKAAQVSNATQQAYNETKKIDQEIKVLHDSIKDTLRNIKDKDSAQDAFTKILNDLNENLNNFNNKLQGVGQLLEGRIQLEKAQSQLDEAEAELNIQQSKLEVTENNAKVQLNAAKEQLDAAKAQIDQAQQQLNRIPKGVLYSLTKNENVGIVSYESYKQAIASIADVFPLIFFLVAALVSLTTMTRMIEEQRSYCGTLRALGYSKQDIIMQYIVYAFLATFFACILGILAGNQVFPRIIYFLFTYLMYGMNQSTVLVQKWSISLMTVLISVGVTLLATLSVCLQELVSTPSVLMRPKAPKAGKRILMERMPFIWKRLNFNQKVTMRNLFRYKKRFWMSVIGIAGCTALIMLGFGVKNSVSDIIPSQYEEVYKYDALIKLNSNVEDTKKVENKIKRIEGVHNLTGAYRQNVTVLGNSEDYYSTMVVYDNADEIKNFINFNDYKTKKKIILSDDGVVISQKLAEKLGVKKGENMTFSYDNTKYTVKVSNIVQQYVSHQVYMSKTFYENLTGTKSSASILYVDMNTKKSNIKTLKNYLDHHNIGSMERLTASLDEFQQRMSSLNIIVAILSGCAALLCFIVLYNLTNINIGERKGEIATIKVLGFRRKEYCDYIFRENIILSLIGASIGMFFGYFLHRFVVLTVEMDNMLFIRTMPLYIYLIAFGMTVGFTIIINLAMRHILDQVDMVESLKSIE